MDALDLLSAPARRLGGLTATERASDGSRESETENDDEVEQAYRLLQTDVVLVGMIAIGILGYASSVLVDRLGMRMMAWNRDETN